MHTLQGPRTGDPLEGPTLGYPPPGEHPRGTPSSGPFQWTPTSDPLHRTPLRGPLQGNLSSRHPPGNPFRGPPQGDSLLWNPPNGLPPGDFIWWTPSNGNPPLLPLQVSPKKCPLQGTQQMEPSWRHLQRPLFLGHTQGETVQGTHSRGTCKLNPPRNHLRDTIQWHPVGDPFKGKTPR